MNLKELYQEIILDHGKILETLERQKILIRMQKDIIHYVEIVFIFF